MVRFRLVSDMSMNRDLKMRKARLDTLIASMESVLVAFSGGVDSSFLLAVCVQTLGKDRVLAVIGDSPTLARKELAHARTLAASLGVNPEIVVTGEMQDDHFLRNPEDRCYYCKKDLFIRLRDMARIRRIQNVLDGTNADDIKGHRPGKMAAAEFQVQSPLAEAGLTKEDVRVLSRQMELPTWNKPAMACLASRFPHGQRITAEALARIEQAEALLRDLGFRNVRVRDHNGLARIEVDHTDIQKLFEADIGPRFRALGFGYVTADLEGFRSGSLNPVGPGQVRASDT